MTILQAGKLPEVNPRIFRGTCNHCGCQVECNDKEASSLGPRCIGGTMKWFINCPTVGCVEKIDLKEIVLREDGPLKSTLGDINQTLGGNVGTLKNTMRDMWRKTHSKEESSTPEDKKDVHTEHCCVIHGCKYGREDECTVMTKRAPQSYICEDCEEDGLRDLTDLRLVLSGTTQTCPYCKHTLP